MIQGFGKSLRSCTARRSGRATASGAAEERLSLAAGVNFCQRTALKGDNASGPEMAVRSGGRFMAALIHDAALECKPPPSLTTLADLDLRAGAGRLYLDVRSRTGPAAV